MFCQKPNAVRGSPFSSASSPAPLIYLLFVAAGIAVAMRKTGDAGVILVVVFVNALLGACMRAGQNKKLRISCNTDR
jgi:hypothetical protein